MKFADEEELELWYSQAKEALDEAFYTALSDHPEKKDALKLKFDKDFKALILKYQAELGFLVDKMNKKK